MTIKISRAFLSFFCLMLFSNFCYGYVLFSTNENIDYVLKLSANETVFGLLNGFASYGTGNTVVISSLL